MGAGTVTSVQAVVIPLVKQTTSLSPMGDTILCLKLGSASRVARCAHASRHQSRLHNLSSSNTALRKTVLGAPTGRSLAARIVGGRRLHALRPSRVCSARRPREDCRCFVSQE